MYNQASNKDSLLGLGTMEHHALILGFDRFRSL